MSFKEMTKEQRERAILKTLGLAIAAVALYMFGIQPLVRNNRARNEEIKDLTDRIQRADRVLRREAEIREDAERARRSILGHLEANVPPRENPLLWATQFAYRQAGAIGLEIRSISEESIRRPAWLRSEEEPARSRGQRTEDEPQEWRSFAPYAVQVSVEAAFPDILLLLAALERENPLLNISSLSIQSDTRLPSIQVTTFSLQWPYLAVPLPEPVQTLLEEKRDTGVAP